MGKNYQKNNKKIKGEKFMLKAKQKMRSILLVCLMMLATLILGLGSLFSAPTTTASAAEATETLSIFADEGTLSGTSISWSGDHFTITNNKGGSSTAIRTSDSDHFRVYASNSGSIATKNGEIITKIVITCTSSSYATACKNTFGDTATASGSTVTIIPTGSPTSVSYDKATAQWRLNKIVITYVEATSCDHNGYATSWIYDSVSKEHYQQCENCENEIEGTRAACSDFNYGDYTTVDGKHTRTATCTVCGGEQTETGDCEVTAEYVRNGNQHTQTGTCSICGDTTTVTEACTLTTGTYEKLDTDDKDAQQHATTTTCSVCEKTETVNEACSFDEGALDDTTLTYTCEHCGYSYTEEVTTHTVTYVVPDGITTIDAVKVAENKTTVLPEADTIEGYTFVGWVESELDEKMETAPTYLAAGTESLVTADKTFYALYSYAEGTGAWTIVTNADNLDVGNQIVIVASESDFALGTTQNTNNRNAVAVTKSGDTVTINSNVQIITLEEGTKSGTLAFNVGNGYLYAASSGSNHLKTQATNNDNGSWTIEITAAGVATIKAQGSNTRNWLRKNSSSALFSCYGSGQNDVSIYMKDGATYYVTAFNTCAHENVNEVIEKATCTESGSRTVTCLDCESEIESEILPALGHDYVDGICQNENCGLQDPASIVYDGYYYLSINDKYAGEKDGNYYKLFDSAPESVDLAYVFYFVKDGETYDMYNMVAGLIAESLTLETQENYSVHITNSEGRILSHNTGYTTYQRLGFYATSSNFPCDITLVPVELSAHIDSASITVGENLTLNYYVTMSEIFATAQMTFTVDGKDYTVDGTPVGGRYVFSLDVPPHYMTENVKAELIFNEITITQKDTYSIKEYTDNQLANVEGSTNEKDIQLKNLLNAITAYGVASSNYKAETGTAGEKVVPESENVFNLENEAGVEQFGAYFTGANVWFDNTNKIMVLINTTENVTMKINGTEVVVTGTTIYTDELLPTQFNDTYTFELYYDGNLMQTLTYSVNSYAYKMQQNANIGALAVALYNYGAAAEIYATPLS